MVQKIRLRRDDAPSGFRYDSIARAPTVEEVCGTCSRFGWSESAVNKWRLWLSCMLCGRPVTEGGINAVLAVALTRARERLVLVVSSPARWPPGALRDLVLERSETRSP